MDLAYSRVARLYLLFHFRPKGCAAWLSSKRQFQDPDFYFASLRIGNWLRGFLAMGITGSFSPGHMRDIHVLFFIQAGRNFSGHCLRRALYFYGFAADLFLAGLENEGRGIMGTKSRIINPEFRNNKKIKNT